MDLAPRRAEILVLIQFQYIMYDRILIFSLAMFRILLYISLNTAPNRVEIFNDLVLDGSSEHVAPI